ncbi:MAG: hypothetical protein EZS28_025639, partial [Streblomastix strix]
MIAEQFQVKSRKRYKVIFPTDYKPGVTQFFKLFVYDDGLHAERILLNKAAQTIPISNKEVEKLIKQRDSELLKRKQLKQKKQVKKSMEKDNQTEDLGSEISEANIQISNEQLQQQEKQNSNNSKNNEKDNNLLNCTPTSKENIQSSWDPVIKLKGFIKQTKLNKKKKKKGRKTKRKRRESDDDYSSENLPSDDSQVSSDTIREQNGEPKIVNCREDYDNILENVLSGNFYLDWQSAPNYNFYGNFQLIQEKRITYHSKLHLYTSFVTLFPFIPIKERYFCNKTSNLLDPQSRTDLCNECFRADSIFFRLQHERLTFEDLSDEDKACLIHWKEHVRLYEHQDQQLEQQIQGLGPHEATFHIDFKENFDLD